MSAPEHFKAAAARCLLQMNLNKLAALLLILILRAKISEFI